MDVEGAVEAGLGHVAPRNLTERRSYLASDHSDSMIQILLRRRLSRQLQQITEALPILSFWVDLPVADQLHHVGIHSGRQVLCLVIRFFSHFSHCRVLFALFVLICADSRRDPLRQVLLTLAIRRRHRVREVMQWNDWARPPLGMLLNLHHLCLLTRAFFLHLIQSFCEGQFSWICLVVRRAIMHSCHP